MGLNAKDWEKKALEQEAALGLPANELVDKLIRSDPPSERPGWLSDPLWKLHLRLFLVSELSTENIDFLQAVDGFKNGQVTAQALCDGYVKENAPYQVNISDLQKGDIIEAYEPFDRDAFVKALDVAYHEVSVLIQSDSYLRFRRNAMEVRAQWLEDLEGVRYATRPGEAETRHDPPDPVEVNTWNEKALKALRSTPTDFFQAGDVVIVANPAAGASPPGTAWLQQQKKPELVMGKVTKRGGLFGAATIMAEGVVRKADFEDCIHAAVPDVQIEYPGSKKEPPAKKGPFAR